jgi:hypothetical protein
MVSRRPLQGEAMNEKQPDRFGKTVIRAVADMFSQHFQPTESWSVWLRCLSSHWHMGMTATRSRGQPSVIARSTKCVTAPPNCPRCGGMVVEKNARRRTYRLCLLCHQKSALY